MCVAGLPRIPLATGSLRRDRMDGLHMNAKATEALPRGFLRVSDAVEQHADQLG